MKHAKDYLEEANVAVPKLSFDEAKAKHDAGTLFVDVRDSGDIAKSGTVKGAARIPRGMMEFRADSEMEQFYDHRLKKDQDIVLICGAGGQAALTGKTLKDMGYEKVFNAGGVPDWKEAGGAMEEG
ncbi:MAG: rhodanese-like domain-containing protein [Pseudomonadota bacterium]